ncbi:LAME_0G15698g1_1 [Lachancea meyersii CBS 8951]|uniref:LAME_0G15698g1_1 n=1 Tax=Lachancea meyersii CBS 8951 TaxID=1266667 RepID=A0A1G4KAW2_9SACH|nr:LAME_0G15698g1_1 [Lachancea meyersii CBS 8951]
MGAALSCCFSSGDSEGEPLIQDAQKGYGSYNDDDDVMQRKLEEEEQKLLAREQELTEIVNNTNDKLIDISMMSNSGIVVQSHDLGDALDGEKGQEGPIDRRPDGLRNVGAAGLDATQREELRTVYSNFFQDLEKQLELHNKSDLIVNL